MTSTRNAIVDQTGRAVGNRETGKRAGNRKRAQVEEIRGIIFVINNRSHNIRTVVAFPASAEVILKVVVELEGLPALQDHRTVEAPSVPEATGSDRRKVVAENPRESLRHVKVRRPVFPVGPGAVGGL